MYFYAQTDFSDIFGKKGGTNRYVIFFRICWVNSSEKRLFLGSLYIRHREESRWYLSSVVVRKREKFTVEKRLADGEKNLKCHKLRLFSQSALLWQRLARKEPETWLHLAAKTGHKSNKNILFMSCMCTRRYSSQSSLCRVYSIENMSCVEKGAFYRMKSETKRL